MLVLNFYWEINEFVWVFLDVNDVEFWSFKVVGFLWLLY
jgi:hypothetical protein